MTEKQASDLWLAFTGRTSTRAWSYCWALLQLQAAVDPVDTVLRACSWGISQLVRG